ncbi:MAG: SpvB/TcaC N-terminal domain-containing protein [Minicystis sp.]
MLGALLAAGAADAQQAVSPVNAALDGAPRMRADRTRFNDIKVADPAERLTLIAPPGVSNDGDASVTYPLVLPQGRRGIQPDLAVRYSSAGSNGWLGVGWDLSIPSVAIDTRWGVPRYDPGVETETYMVAGAQVTPVAHRGAPVARTADRTFHTRVEGSFERIVRHGDHPWNYSWEVTDQKGVRYLYGDDPAGPLGTHTLRDDSGNIFHWALRRVDDLTGNGCAYTYAMVTDTGVAGGSVPGRQMYPKTINYTQSGGAAGPFSVTFVRDRELGLPRRPDVAIDGRGGFKMVTGDLLKRVEVTFNGQLVRRYDLDYTTNGHHNSFLSAITQRGEDLSVFHTHTFDYYDEPLGFGAPEAWNPGSDGIGSPELALNGAATALGGSISVHAGGHVYLGFNPTNPTKENSFGGKIGFSFNENDGVAELVDINGDGLPDKVVKTLSGVFVRYNQSGPGGGVSFGPLLALPTLPAFSSEQSIMISFGVEAYPFGASALLNFSETFGIGSKYLADVNGDGLMDLVSDGQVLFNHHDGTGTPYWSSDSSTTPVPVGVGAVDTDGIVPDYESSYQRQIDMFPLADSVRRWVAPYDGVVAITGAAALLQSTDPARAAYKTADGVRVAIQQNGSELWSDDIGATDYGPHAPVGVNALTVQAGDRLYFRVQSVFDGSYDQVAWDPEIAYVGTPAATDVNGLNPHDYKASADFTLAGRPHSIVQAPINGTLHLAGALQKTAATTDDVTLLLLRNGVPVLQQAMGAAQTGTISPVSDVAVAKGDTLELRVAADSPISLTAIQWAPSLYYVSTPDLDSNGNPIPVFDDQNNPIIEIPLGYDVDQYPADGLTAPQASWPAPSTGTISVTPQITAAPGANGTVVFTVKRPGELLAKQVITLNNGTASPAALSVDVTQGDALYFDFSVGDPDLAAKITASSAAVGSTAVPSVLHAAKKPDLFPVAYRGWSVVGYNGNRDYATLPIDEARLVPPVQNGQSDCDTDSVHTEDDFQSSACNPSGASAWAYSALPADGIWRGTAEKAWVAGGVMSSSRAGAPYISVPRPGQFAGASAVLRVSHNSQLAVGAGFKFLGFSATPLGISEGITDFVDLNGDGFPDILGPGKIQYTSPTGALEPSSRSVPGFDGIRRSINFAEGLGVSGNPTMSSASAKGKVGASSRGAPKGNGSGTQMATLGLSGNLGLGQSDLNTELMDVNGDGLPDRVSHTIGGPLMVALNLGYGFAPAETWGAAAINEGSSGNFSVGVSPSFNDGGYGFAGGVSISGDVSQSACKVVDPIVGACGSGGWMLTDVNGDGLPDRVSANGSSLKVALNLGYGFAPEIDWATPLGGVASRNRNISLGGGAYFTIPVGPLCLAACYLIINPGFDLGVTMSRQEVSFVDVDGDGHPDHVTSSSDGQLTVARNLYGRTGLLKTIRRPLGAVIDLAYERDGNTFAHAASRWNLTRVSTFDGHPGDGADTRVTTYRYAGGFYDRLEREFYGYAQVIAEERDHDNGDALYRSTVSEYQNDSHYAHGLMTRQTVLDGAGRPFTQTEDTYAFRDVDQGVVPADVHSTTATIFPMRIRSDRRFYEGSPTPGKSTFVTYQYDALGRTIQMADTADAGIDDDTVQTTDYASCGGTYVLGVPTRVAVRDAHGVELRRTERTVDCNTGLVTQTRDYLDAQSAAVTDTTYYADGNARQTTGPVNANGQRFQTTYTYDAATATYVAKATDSFGYVTTSAYDPKHGNLLGTTDANLSTTSYTYDVFGRATSVRLPNEQGGATPTVSFEYHPEAAVPWAITRRFDALRSPGDTIDGVVFIDGERRTIQTKQDAALYAGVNQASADVMIVSGRRTYDLVGRVIQERYPVVEPLGSAGVFNTAVDGVAPMVTAYDVLDRTVVTTMPDGTQWVDAFDFGADYTGVTRFRASTRDPNGVIQYVYRDVRDLVTGVQELNKHATEVLWTTYIHDASRDLTDVIDDHGNVTVVAHDNLGRRTAILSPDAGFTQLSYDLAGNLVSRVTPNLRAAGQAITYHYDFNRLTDVVYPRFPENGVHYTYGGPGAAGNGAGRITRVDDSSGYEARAYGKRGEITQSVRQIKEKPSRGGDLYGTYTTQYAYDSFGRLSTLTYPDGEVVTHAYGSGGDLRAVTGVKGATAYTYASRVEYDKFGTLVFVEAGNGVQTASTFDPVMLRLSSLRTGKGGKPIQNVAYAYDPTGNLTGLTNNVPVPSPNAYGGPSAQSFAYDDLHRLTGASGSYQFSPGKTRTYALSMAYDTIHNITQKQQADTVYNSPSKPLPQAGTTYSTGYVYGSAAPHAATHVDGRTFQYDADGNQAGWQNDSSGARRTIVWNEDDRIESISDNGSLTYFQYNDAGDRVLRRGGNGRTVYVNAYFTDDPGGNATKHFFAGTTRIATKLVSANLPEVKQYFYHPDHAGNTTYITDVVGDLYQHLEYFPFGETWVEDNSSTSYTPYLFGGKELDDATDLYFFGARYYDARTSLWQSADPALSTFLDGSGEGGVFRPMSLQLFAYAAQNPAGYGDPDGRDRQAVLDRFRQGGYKGIYKARVEKFLEQDLPKLDFGTGEKAPAFWSGGMGVGEAQWTARNLGYAVLEDTPGAKAVELATARSSAVRALLAKAGNPNTFTGLTPRGEDGKAPADKGLTEKVWEEASARYAANAANVYGPGGEREGEAVPVVRYTEKYRGAASIWEKVEKKRLRSLGLNKTLEIDKSKEGTITKNTTEEP